MKTSSKPSSNLGGIIKIWAIPPTDIKVSNFSTEILSTENIVHPYCTPETIQFIEDGPGNGGSVSYEAEITAIMPQDCPENDELIGLLIGRKWIVIFLDANEQFKVSGTNGIPHRFSYRKATGKLTSDLNSYEISFSSTQLKMAIPISDPSFNS